MNVVKNLKRVLLPGLEPRLQRARCDQLWVVSEVAAQFYYDVTIGVGDLFLKAAPYFSRWANIPTRSAYTRQHVTFQVVDHAQDYKFMNS